MVIGIPVAKGDQFRAAKVLFCSKYFRNLILIAFHRSPVIGDGVNSFDSAEFSGRRVYTGAQIIRNGRWKILGECDLTQEESNASLRIVAGDVWLGDQHMRAASARDIESLPRMDAAGAALVEKWANE